MVLAVAGQLKAGQLKASCLGSQLRFRGALAHVFDSMLLHGGCGELLSAVRRRLRL
jgi:hypothetical protein